MPSKREFREIYDNGEIRSNLQTKANLAARMGAYATAGGRTAKSILEDISKEIKNPSSQEVSVAKEYMLMSMLGGPVLSSVIRSGFRGGSSALKHISSRFKENYNEPIPYEENYIDYNDDSNRRKVKKISAKPNKIKKSTSPKSTINIENNSNKQQEITVTNLKPEQEIVITGKKNKTVLTNSKNSTNKMINTYEQNYNYIKEIEKIKKSIYGRNGMSSENENFADYISEKMMATMSGGKLKHGFLSNVKEFTFSLIGHPAFLRYRSQLPRTKRMGVFNAMNQTLGMIYIALRTTQAENIRLLYDIAIINKAGLGVNMKVKKPNISVTGPEFAATAITRTIGGLFQGLSLLLKLTFGIKGNVGLFRSSTKEGYASEGKLMAMIQDMYSSGVGFGGGQRHMRRFVPSEKKGIFDKFKWGGKGILKTLLPITMIPAMLSRIGLHGVSNAMFSLPMLASIAGTRSKSKFTKSLSGLSMLGLILSSLGSSPVGAGLSSIIGLGTMGSLGGIISGGAAMSIFVKFAVRKILKKYGYNLEGDDGKTNRQKEGVGNKLLNTIFSSHIDKTNDKIEKQLEIVNNLKRKLFTEGNKKRKKSTFGFGETDTYQDYIEAVEKLNKLSGGNKKNQHLDTFNETSYMGATGNLPYNSPYSGYDFMNLGIGGGGESSVILRSIDSRLETLISSVVSIKGILSGTQNEQIALSYKMENNMEEQTDILRKQNNETKKSGGIKGILKNIGGFIFSGLFALFTFFKDVASNLFKRSGLPNILPVGMGLKNLFGKVPPVIPIAAGAGVYFYRNEIVSAFKKLLEKIPGMRNILGSTPEIDKKFEDFANKKTSLFATQKGENEFKNRALMTSAKVGSGTASMNLGGKTLKNLANRNIIKDVKSVTSYLTKKTLNNEAFKKIAKDAAGKARSIIRSTGKIATVAAEIPGGHALLIFFKTALNNRYYNFIMSLLSKLPTDSLKGVLQKLVSLVARSSAKLSGKSIPYIGISLNVVSAMERLLSKGDVNGALMEIGIGGMKLIPFAGNISGILGDISLLVRDCINIIKTELKEKGVDPSSIDINTYMNNNRHSKVEKLFNIYDNDRGKVIKEAERAGGLQNLIEELENRENVIVRIGKKNLKEMDISTGPPTQITSGSSEGEGEFYMTNMEAQLGVSGVIAEIEDKNKTLLTEIRDILKYSLTYDRSISKNLIMNTFSKISPQYKNRINKAMRKSYFKLGINRFDNKSSINPMFFDVGMGNRGLPGGQSLGGGPGNGGQSLGGGPGSRGLNSDYYNLGIITAREESGNDPGAVNSRYGWIGTFQMAENTTKGFFEQYPQYAQHFRGLSYNTPAFNKKWKEIASNDSNFKKAQYDYIKLSHYDPMVSKIKNETGIDINERSLALKNIIWSTAVQFGPNSPVPIRAIKEIDSNNLTDESIIKSISNERGRRHLDGTAVHFSRYNRDEQNAYLKRFPREEEVALSMLRAEQQGLNDVDVTPESITLSDSKKMELSSISDRTKMYNDIHTADLLSQSIHDSISRLNNSNNKMNKSEVLANINPITSVSNVNNSNTTTSNMTSNGAQSKSNKLEILKEDVLKIVLGAVE